MFQNRNGKTKICFVLRRSLPDKSIQGQGPRDRADAELYTVTPSAMRSVY
jgi:hypothetical protein